MLMELVKLSDARPADPEGAYVDELHDVNTIIMDMCASLGDTKAFDFRVSGFGDDHWPVDVSTDLATVLEQLPDALRASRRGDPFTIDFFEQGVQRRLDFVPLSGGYQVECTSGTEWLPNPATELIASAELVTQLSELGRRFTLLATELLPRTASHEWFASYAQSIV